MSMTQYMPVRLQTGAGCVRKAGKFLSALGDRCLIVTGKHSARLSGALDDVLSVLEEEGILWKHVDCIGQNPRFADCRDAAAEAVSFGARFIIGIGGGSALDGAKCTAVLSANEGMTQDAFYTLPWPKKPLATVLVGTTAGSGSEVTKVAVITTEEGKKKSIKDDSLYPVLSLGDPAYTATLPESFTRSTAVDAFAHCMESYFCKTANDLSRAYAIRGIRILLREFRKLQKDGVQGLDPSDREALYNASIYGGLAINITGTTMPHTAGYLLTERHGLAHGTACAVFLPEFYFLNRHALPELTEGFLREAGCTETELLDLLAAVTPECHVVMTEEEIRSEHGRWEGNRSLANGLAVMDASAMDTMLRRMFSA